MFGGVEEFVWEVEWVDDVYGVVDVFYEVVFLMMDVVVEFGVEFYGVVEVFCGVYLV